MKPAPFKYIAARSAEQAVAGLAAWQGSARLLAGGQSLIPLMNLRMARPAALIDLGTCEGLSYLRREGDWIAVGPMTLQAAVEHSPLIHECCPLVAKTMRYLGSPTIRNRGTIGGTLAHADRVAELPGVAVALRAQMIAQGPGGRRRTIPAEAFYVADLTTALQPDEMLREIRFPVAAKAHRCAFVEASNRHHDLATVGVAVSIEADTTRIVAIGIGPTPVLLDGEAEAEGDFHASAEYRRRVLQGLVKRALAEARQ